MKSLEFRTKINNKGNIEIPQFIKQNIKNGSLVYVAVFDEGVKEINGKLINVGQTYEEQKNFWNNYQDEESWNGE